MDDGCGRGGSGLGQLLAQAQGGPDQTISLLWIPVSLIAGQGINPALVPLVLTIMVRLFRHCGFGKDL